MTTMKLMRGAAIRGRLRVTGRRFAGDSTGATAVEYAVMTFIAIAIVLAITQLGDSAPCMSACKPPS